MAASDASPVPFKGVAYRVTFPIWKNDSTLITGASGLDSEVSKDAGTFADCTNEATEIATSSGIYYLDLSASEMDARTVAVIVKSSSTGAVTTVIVLYPEDKLQVDGVVGSGSTTTSIVTSSLNPAAAVADQFKGRVVIFDQDTATANLRGQATDITANTSGGVLTVTALSDAPSSGDTFKIV